MLYSFSCILQALNLILEGPDLVLMIAKVFDMVFDGRDRVLCSASDNGANDFHFVFFFFLIFFSKLREKMRNFPFLHLH
ncbi:Uncharacterized protein TCM_046042 [Theobroma cacao]|uniref:Uncharacterized protein n=1 Tax=Theobroma cacao TaxID=3641 RepID=S1S430_THECC|nr:Uncharacterized protein TCM_046042 [Theobroma cacao]